MAQSINSGIHTNKGRIRAKSKTDPDNVLVTQGGIVLTAGRQWLEMIEGSKKKDYETLAPIMEEIEEYNTVNKLNGNELTYRHVNVEHD